MTAEQPQEPTASRSTSPYSPSEGPRRAQQQSGRRISIIVRGLAAIDFVLGTVVSGMMVDSLWGRNLLSLLIFSLTTVTAWGLFFHRIWGWWCGVILHSVVLAGGVLAYLICMLYLMSDFGRPPGHMALITSEGAAALLTIAFVPAALLASVPLFLLRRCRSRFRLI